MLDNQMDTGGGSPAGAKGQSAPRPEFEGFVECPLFAEEAKLTLDKDGLLIAARFDQLPIPYGEITAFALKDYRVTLQTAGGGAVISRLGQSAQWLYDKLYGAYNGAVLSALGVEGAHQFEAAGEYGAEENSRTWQGHAVIRLYEDCLCILPPDEQARRIPLCFLSGMEKDGFSMTLTLATGERYTLSKLGWELDNLDRLLTEGLRALRERTLEFLKELEPNLGSMQSAAAAKLMPLGTAAPLAMLSAAAPPLVAALEGKIGESRMEKTWPWLRDLCGGDGLYLGAKPAPKKQEQEAPAQPGMPAMPGMPPTPPSVQAATSDNGQPGEAAGAENRNPSCGASPRTGSGSWRRWSWPWRTTRLRPPTSTA